MSLVTLIQKLEKDARDAVVQIEEWSLPKAAVFTNKLDEAGRKIYSLFEADVVKVKADVAVVTAKAKVTANTIKSDVTSEVKKVEAKVANLVSEVKTELANVESKVESVLKSL